MKYLILSAAATFMIAANAAEPAATALVTVDFTNEVRAIKPMHAVNNGTAVIRMQPNSFAIVEWEQTK